MLYHLDICMQAEGRNAHCLHAHYNHKSEEFPILRDCITSIGKQEQCTGPYRILYRINNGKEIIENTATMMLTGDMNAAYFVRQEGRKLS